MTARMIVKESEEVTKMAKKVAAVCTDKRMKNVRNNIVLHVTYVLYRMNNRCIIE